MFRRSWFYLLVLGLGLLTLGLVVRSGMLMRKNPGEPINAAMRAALSSERAEYSTADDLMINQLYPTFSETPSGLRFVVLGHGTGGAKPKAGDEVAVSYTGRFLGGAVFAHSDRLEFRVGLGNVIKGWDEALLDMAPGEERTVIVPWWLAYGADGRPPTIPPKATLVFDVKLLEVR
jgi:FKBP-type peptidyl-prolyl cis-trans isomerase